MKRLAFIDHSVHRKTLSSQFFIDLLEKTFVVDVFWCDSWKTGKFDQLEKFDPAGYDVIVFFQVMYPLDKIKGLKDKCIFVPMFDGARNDSDLFWFKYREFRFISFSETLHRRLRRLRINSLHVRYYPAFEPMDSDDSDSNPEGLTAFFLERTPEISWNVVKRLVEGSGISTMYYHNPFAREEGMNIPDRESISRYGITFSDWFESREDYLMLVKSARIYFAPRLYEGIGMTFLEAMALGRCVVAPNHPTMNEYITDGINGILYNPRFPKPINFDNVGKICEAAARSSREGLAEWRDKENEIIGFINDDKPYTDTGTAYLFIRSLLTTAVVRPWRSMGKLFDRFWFYLIRKGII